MVYAKLAPFSVSIEIGSPSGGLPEPLRPDVPRLLAMSRKVKCVVELAAAASALEGVLPKEMGGNKGCMEDLMGNLWHIFMAEKSPLGTSGMHYYII